MRPKPWVFVYCANENTAGEWAFALRIGGPRRSAGYATAYATHPSDLRKLLLTKRLPNAILILGAAVPGYDIRKAVEATEHVYPGPCVIATYERGVEQPQWASRHLWASADDRMLIFDLIRTAATRKRGPTLEAQARELMAKETEGLPPKKPVRSVYSNGFARP